MQTQTNFSVLGPALSQAIALDHIIFLICNLNLGKYYYYDCNHIQKFEILSLNLLFIASNVTFSFSRRDNFLL